MRYYLLDMAPNFELIDIHIYRYQFLDAQMSCDWCKA